MSEFKPVETKEELDLLDPTDVVEGYRWGLENPQVPGSDKSRGFYHGWRNAQTDKGRMPLEVSQQRLVRSLLGSHVNAH